MTDSARWQTVLDELTSILPPPANPDGGELSWSETEAAIGMALPDDFKAFADRYGPGEINLLIDLFDFRFPDTPELVDEILATPRQIRESFPDEYELAIFPEPGGIFPFATTSNGDDLHWATDPLDSPNDWTVVLHNGRNAEVVHFDGSFVDMLLAALTGHGDLAGILPSDFSSMPRQFVPWQPK